MDAKQLFGYKMDEEEQAEWISLKKQIYEDCEKADIPESFMRSHVDTMVSEKSFEHSAGYCRYAGFYYVYSERGNAEKLYSGDEAGMRFFLLKDIFRSFGMKCECENREKLSQEWKSYQKDMFTLKPPLVKCTRAVSKTVKNKNYIYGARYDSRKFWFEYTINSIDKILGLEYSSQVIEEYTKFMNRWFDDEHWAFDKASGKFIEISESEEKE
ncbi:MAG: hypothetical protein K2J72_10690 [Oscillospiraceae bacterium]|nr:hypothetical protein [Oscillospiraceae bacterium]